MLNGLHLSPPPPCIQALITMFPRLAGQELSNDRSHTLCIVEVEVMSSRYLVALEPLSVLANDVEHWVIERRVLEWDAWLCSYVQVRAGDLARVREYQFLRKHPQSRQLQKWKPNSSSIFDISWKFNFIEIFQRLCRVFSRHYSTINSCGVCCTHLDPRVSSEVELPCLLRRRQHSTPHEHLTAVARDRASICGVCYFHHWLAREAPCVHSSLLNLEKPATVHSRCILL